LAVPAPQLSIEQRFAFANLKPLESAKLMVTGQWPQRNAKSIKERLNE